MTLSFNTGITITDTVSGLTQGSGLSYINNEDSFNPDNIVDSYGVRRQIQKLLVSVPPGIDGTIYDERTGLGDPRAPVLPALYAFDGSNDYVSFGNPAAVQITGALTISFYVKTNGATADGLVSKYSATGNQRGYAASISASDATKLSFNCQPVGGSFSADASLNSVSDPFDNTWHHIACTFEPSTFMRIYIDGVLDAEKTSAVPASIHNSTTDLQLGLLDTGYLTGSLSDVRIYNVALTGTQVAAMYAHPTLFTYPDNLAFQAKCDERSGTDSFDSSGNGNHGTLINGVTHATDSTLSVNWANDVGYTLDGAVFVPRDESDTGFDVNGDPLQFAGEVPRNGKLKQSPCGTFDGVNDHQTCAITMNGWTEFTIYARQMFRSTTARTHELDGFTNAGGAKVRMGRQTSDNTIFWNVGTITNYSNAATLENDVWHTLAVASESGGTAELYLNGAQIDSISPGSYTISNAFTYTVCGAREASILYLSNKSVAEHFIYNRKLTADEILFLHTQGAEGDDPGIPTAGAGWIYEEYSGAIIYDIFDLNDGTIVNATTSQGAGFWLNKQDFKHRNFFNGFRWTGSGARIPAKYDGSSAANGSALTHVAAYIPQANGLPVWGTAQSGVVTQLDMTDGAAFASLQSAYTFNGTLTNPNFFKQADSSTLYLQSEGTFMSYDTALTGQDYVDVLKYFGHYEWVGANVFFTGRNTFGQYFDDYYYAGEPAAYWNDLDFAQSNDQNYTYVDAINLTNEFDPTYTNGPIIYDFSLFSVPADVDMSGVEVRTIINGAITDVTVGTLHISLADAEASQLGTFKSLTFPADSPTQVTFGGQGDLWDATLTPGAFNNEFFGLTFYAEADPDEPFEPQIYYIELGGYFEVPL